MLEVIDNLKEGTLSLDKIIRDLEAGGDDNIILNKDDLAAVAVEETYIETTESIKPTETVVDSQPCPEIITLSDDTISISPNTVSMTVDETQEQSDRILIVNHPTSEKSPIIVQSHDDISRVSSSLNNIECESSTSELSSISLGIENIETATMETNIHAETPPNRNSPSIETELVKQTVENAQQLVVTKSIANVSQLQEVDVLSAEDSRLSGEGYVTCESISEAGETVDSIVDDQEPPILSKVDDVDESESRDEIGSVNKETAKFNDEAAIESADVTESDERAEIVVAIPEREAEMTPSEIEDKAATVVQVEEVEQVNNVEKHQEIVDSQPPPLNNVITKEITEQVELKAEETTVKRRPSVSSRPNETRTQLEDERCLLESIPEESVSADKPPQLQSQPPAENHVAADVDTRILQTSEKEVVNDGEEDASKSRSAARKQARKRKSISESEETTLVKTPRKIVDASEPPTPLGNKELNITIKDLRDNMDPSLEAEL